VTRRTLAEILATDYHFARTGKYKDEVRTIASGRERLTLEKEGRLEIMYYPPGYITSEEFLHRLLITVARLKNGIKEKSKFGLTLLFNSFDQLPSRFPLCARESMLIPAIVQMLNSEDVTSFFVAAKSSGQTDGLYGLESTADLILEVERRSYRKEQYLRCIEALIGKKETDRRLAMVLGGGATGTRVGDALGDWRRIVVMDVVRYPGVEAMGRRGFVELVSPQDEVLLSLYDDEPGLHFVPDAPGPDAMS